MNCAAERQCVGHGGDNQPITAMRDRKKRRGSRIITCFTNHKIDFIFDESVEDAKIYITFSQGGRTVIEYSSGDGSIELSDCTVSLSMTPDETGLFDAGARACGAVVQCNVIKDGTRRATRPVKIPVHMNLKAEGV
ncbi:MAG: hypothetical protein LUH59_01175 [Firmicutes bacterium]|nr:hypothetical protein [Bacillota bacterium]